jgi:hypothetical protein
VGLAPTGKRRLFTAHANNRHMQCSKKHRHSITSSARPSSVIGNVRAERPGSP